MVVVEITGVVNVVVPCESKLPPVAASYQSKVIPAPSDVPVNVIAEAPHEDMWGTTALDETPLNTKDPFELNV